ncbi:hypothetical protein DID88_001627 [Monilinia fructigena]|uniref:Cell wall protein n=1 Tax=Monilinia fructigena TaxID=38457 RepID=A0A395IWG3_9HELO|nr:hypothetical protein DID88_001627 [Monilinia fructigena]
MQIKASLVAVLGLTATGFAAPQLSNPEIRSVAYGASERLGPNFELKPDPSSSTTTSYSYTANGVSSKEGDSKKQTEGSGSLTGGLADDILIPETDLTTDLTDKTTPVTDLTTDLTDKTTPVTDLTTDFTSNSVSLLRITDVVTSVRIVKTTVVEDVSCIQDLIKSVGNNTVGQKGLGEEIIKDLGDIVTVLTTTLEGTLAKTLPSVVNVAVTEVKEILAILDDVEAVVFQIVQVLNKLLGGLVTSTLKTVTTEVTEVYKLLGSVLTPVLKFVDLVQCDGQSDLVQQVATAVSGIVSSCNGLLGAKGLKEIDIEIKL